MPNKSFNVRHGITVGANQTPVVDANGNITANTISSNGDLTLSGGKRILGDFSNADLTSRTRIESSTPNSVTAVSITPSTIGYNVALNLESDPAFANASLLQLAVFPSTETRINSGIRGTGTYLPLKFYTSNTERIVVSTSSC